MIGRADMGSLATPGDGECVLVASGQTRRLQEEPGVDLASCSADALNEALNVIRPGTGQGYACLGLRQVVLFLKACHLHVALACTGLVTLLPWVLVGRGLVTLPCFVLAFIRCWAGAAGQGRGQEYVHGQLAGRRERPADVGQPQQCSRPRRQLVFPQPFKGGGQQVCSLEGRTVVAVAGRWLDRAAIQSCLNHFLCASWAERAHGSRGET